MLKKQIFQQKPSCDIFKSVLDVDLMFFWGAKHIPWAHSEAITKPSTISTAKPPSPLVNSCLLWRFFKAIFTYSMG